MTVFFVSDTHFGHKNIIKYCNRPYKDIEEMDKTLINNWNSVITNKDTVYHLGDFVFNNFDCLDKLNGRIDLVPGNHDYKRLNILKKRCDRILGSIHEVVVEDQLIILCHYAMKVWDRSHRGSWQLFGHSHGSLDPKTLSPRQLDVGVDCWNYYPVSFENIFNKIKEQESLYGE